MAFVRLSSNKQIGNFHFWFYIFVLCKKKSVKKDCCTGLFSLWILQNFSEDPFLFKTAVFGTQWNIYNKSFVEKMVNGLPLTILRKSAVIDVSLGSKYTSVEHLQTATSVSSLMLFTVPLQIFVWFSCSVCQNWSYAYFPAEYSLNLICRLGLNISILISDR